MTTSRDNPAYTIKKYIAPNPYQTEMQKFFARFFSLNASKESIGRLILQAQSRPPAEKLTNAARTFIEKNYSVTLGGIEITTHDNAVLDTVEIASTKPNLLNPLHIIKFNGNGGQYEDSISSCAKDATILGASVVVFNYRNVGNSKKAPLSFQDLVTDGIAQVQRLIDEGVASTSILLDGISLGGGIATMVAAHFHKIHKPVYLWNDRSFASISNATAGILAPELPGMLGDLVQESSALSFRSILQSTAWEVDVATAYKSIPEKYKGYVYVAKKSANCAGDGVISHHASLHAGVKNYEKTHISTKHKVVAAPCFFGGHNLSRTELTQVNTDKTAHDLFIDFAHKISAEGIQFSPHR